MPNTAKEIILIPAITGGSKTTTGTNVAWSAIKQKNPDTGKNGKVLYITNEENEEDIFNRIACLAKLDAGEDDSRWYYADRSKFRDDQVEYFSAFMRTFRNNGCLTVIGLDFEDIPQFTRNLENVLEVLNQAAENPGTYTCIVFDYYQNISISTNNPLLNQYQVQAEFAASLNFYKEKVGCPIVILAQTNEPKKDVPWNERIKGSKAIAQPATFVMEACPRRSTYTTDWIIHKSRFAGSGLSKVVTGFKYGRILPLNDPSFIPWVEQEISSRNRREAADHGKQKELDAYNKKNEMDELFKEPTKKQS